MDNNGKNRRYESVEYDLYENYNGVPIYVNTDTSMFMIPISEIYSNIEDGKIIFCWIESARDYIDLHVGRLYL